MTDTLTELTAKLILLQYNCLKAKSKSKKLYWDRQYKKTYKQWRKEMDCLLMAGKIFKKV